MRTVLFLSALFLSAACGQSAPAAQTPSAPGASSEPAGSAPAASSTAATPPPPAASSEAMPPGSCVTPRSAGMGQDLKSCLAGCEKFEDTVPAGSKCIPPRTSCKMQCQQAMKMNPK